MTHNMPTVSVVIPTCNRPDLLPRAIRSVLAQTYQDLEIIVVDDGMKVRAESFVASLGDTRIRYIKNETSLGGSGARNRGIKEAKGEYVAFLDDDDEWFPEKLSIQMGQFADTNADVGFCFSSVVSVYDDHEEVTKAKGGVSDFSLSALTRFKGFLTSTLVVRKGVFEEVGGFDESLPSHQEAELIIRISRKYKGLGINQPLISMNMHPHERIGGDLSRRIRGKELVLEKHAALYAKHPRALAKQYFWLALWCRDSRQTKKAKEYFWKAFHLSRNPRYLVHALRTFFQ